MIIRIPTLPLVIATLLYGLVSLPVAHAITIIDESAYTDYSNVLYDTAASPTSVGIFANDTYQLNGQVGWGGDTVDTFTFEIAVGQVLQSAVFTIFDPAISNDYVSVYMNRGDHISFTTGDEVEFINLASFDIGTDLLQFDSAPGPQGAGSYTMRWDSHDGPSNYQIEFVVSAVPVPATIWLLGSGLVCLSGLARKTKQGDNQDKQASRD